MNRLNMMATALLALAVALPVSQSAAQQMQRIAYKTLAANTKYTQQHFIEVGDVAGHQVRVNEIYRTFPNDPPVINGLKLKEHWSRPRPIDVAQFGGDEHFRPWWDPRGDCPANCSFIAGEPTGAFWTIAGAAVVPPQWRALAYVAALTFGSAVGLQRMAAGAHFFSDIAFAGVIAFLVIWLAHGWLYRWAPTRISDDAVDKVLERIAGPPHDALRRILPSSKQ